MAIQDTDLFLIDRNNTNYKVEAQDIMAIEDTDLLLVDRGGSNYKLQASDLKDYASLPYGSLLKEYTAPWSSVGTKNFAASPNAICLIDSAGNVRRSTDGFVWSTVTTLSYTYGLIPNNSIAYGGDNIWLIWGASGGTFYRSTDDGLTWSAFTPTYNDWGNAETNDRTFYGLLGAPTTSSSNFAVVTSSDGGGSRLNYSTDGGSNWTLSIISSDPFNLLNAAAATINNSPVWVIARAFPTHGYYTINNGTSWALLGSGYDGITYGIVGGGGNVICSSFSERIGDVIYPNALNYYDGTNIVPNVYYRDGSTYSFPGLTGILDNFSNINGFNGTGTHAAGGELISHIGTYQNKIAAIGTQGTFLLTSTDKTGICTRQDNITSSGVGILGFKNRFFFFSSTDEVYYTSRFN